MLSGKKSLLCYGLSISDRNKFLRYSISSNLVDAIYACPNGVERFIPTIPDTVETSSNLAIVEIGNGKAAIKVLTRSSRESMKDYRNTAIESCFSMAGMHVERSGSYSGWEPDVNSPILHAMKESYKAQFGETPEVKVIHAGLECGIIGAVDDVFAGVHRRILLLVVCIKLDFLFHKLH